MEIRGGQRKQRTILLLTRLFATSIGMFPTNIVRFERWSSLSSAGLYLCFEATLFEDFDWACNRDSWIGTVDVSSSESGLSVEWLSSTFFLGAAGVATLPSLRENRRRLREESCCFISSWVRGILASTWVRFLVFSFEMGTEEGPAYNSGLSKNRDKESESIYAIWEYVV